MTAHTEYKIPSAGERGDWQRDVRASIGSGQLAWEHVVGSSWALRGRCPRCHDSMSNVFDFKVIVAESISSTDFDASQAETFTTQVVCNCTPDPPHKEDAEGCGYGIELEIELEMPEGV